MELQPLADLGSGFFRMMAPMMFVVLSAYCFQRVGVVNVALDGQIILAGSVYVVMSTVIGSGFGSLVALMTILALSAVLVLGRDLLGLSDLLVGLGLLYLGIGASRIVAGLGSGSPGYARLEGTALGTHVWLLAGLVLVAVLGIAEKMLTGMRTSKLLAESDDFARLENLSPLRWRLIHAAIGSCFLLFAACYLVELGGAYTSQVSGQRGFVALAIVAVGGLSVERLIVWTIPFALASALGLAGLVSIELSEVVPFVFAIFALAYKGLVGDRKVRRLIG